MNIKYIDELQYYDNFNRNTLYETMSKYNHDMSTSAFKKELQKRLQDGEIIRIGRNLYTIHIERINRYSYIYSDLSNEISKTLQLHHPSMSFNITELFQLNEFIKHQISHNILFLMVEKDLEDFVFETLRNNGYENVLLSPDITTLHRYRKDNMIVIKRLITESPKGRKEAWHTCIEKLLVDITADKLIASTFSESEITNIFETAKSKYIIDSSKLTRYARRRSCDDKLQLLLNEISIIQEV